MRKFHLSFALALAGASLVLPASADTVCGQGMIRNKYGFVASGTGSNGVACASTGTITFTSATQLTVTVRSSCSDGTTSSSTTPGTYSLAPSCIGSASGDGLVFQFTVVNGGNGIVFIQDMPGIVFSGTAIKT